MPLCTYESDKAVIRVYIGKMTAEERKSAMEEAAKQFCREIMKQKKEVRA